MSIGKYILIDPDECPARDELSDAIVRLNKCALLLEKMPSKKDPNTTYLRRVASFLEMLYKDNRLKHTMLSDDEESLALEDIAASKVKKDEEKKSDHY